MRKPFLDMLQEWAETANFKELDGCEFKVREMLRNYGRVVAEMEADKTSFMWKDNFALAVRAELKRLKSLIKLIDKVYKNREPNETTVEKF